LIGVPALSIAKSVPLSRSARPWGLILPAVFIVVSGWQSAGAMLEWKLIGSHALIYTEAARTWLAGGDPWSVGPPSVVFAGPPTMLLPFVPFALLAGEITRWAWVLGDLAVAIAVLKALKLPAWWLAFPPLVSAIELGHPEVLILGLLLVKGPIAGLAAVVKPYAVLPLVAERNWSGLAVAAITVVVTVPFLPWGMFMTNMPHITATLASQWVGDSVYGQPVLMSLILVAAVPLGLRRFLWLATPVLWPYAQPIYKVPSLPMMSPLIALAWSIPIPGMTAVGLLGAASLCLVARRWALPPWLYRGLDSPLLAFDREGRTADRTAGLVAAPILSARAQSSR